MLRHAVGTNAPLHPTQMPSISAMFATLAALKTPGQRLIGEPKRKEPLTVAPATGCAMPPRACACCQQQMMRAVAVQRSYSLNPSAVASCNHAWKSSWPSMSTRQSGACICTPSTWARWPTGAVSNGRGGARGGLVEPVATCCAGGRGWSH